MASGMTSLADKTILVTGASKGIGAAIVRALGEAGAAVIAHYGADRAGAAQATSDIPADRRLLLAADFHDLVAVEAMWRQAVDWRGGVDVLVNNAAIMLWHGGLNSDDATWDAVWQETLQVNVLAPARLLRAAVRHSNRAAAGSS
jgi:NAD(P)-dependent dehydrogenase (short-subunit alcohol dehydrogenase family)